jgi:NADPH:quinone reductase
VPNWVDTPHNSGDDVAGYIDAVGPGVDEFRKGDRVAGFHVIRGPSGAFAEYAIVPSHTAFHIPPETSFEEASTIPLAALTSAVAIFHTLDLPSPWAPAVTTASKTPLVVYGASTAIGAFAIKLAVAANIHPIIAVGSSNSGFVAAVLNPVKGDKMLDYKSYETPDKLSTAIQEALVESGIPDGKAFHVFDTVSEPDTYNMLAKAVAGPPSTATGKKPRVAVVLPGKNYGTADSSVDMALVSVGMLHRDVPSEKLFGYVWSRAFTRGLRDGWFTPHPHEVRTGGLNGLGGALRDLRDGKVRGKKVVVRVGETEGLGN